MGCCSSALVSRFGVVSGVCDAESCVALLYSSQVHVDANWVPLPLCRGLYRSRDGPVVPCRLTVVFVRRSFVSDHLFFLSVLAGGRSAIYITWSILRPSWLKHSTLGLPMIWTMSRSSISSFNKPDLTTVSCLDHLTASCHPISMVSWQKRRLAVKSCPRRVTLRNLRSSSGVMDSKARTRISS